MWNARVKDELEELLPVLVCRGQVDLATAQRDIAVNWIAAYKRYFHTDRPVSVGPSGRTSEMGGMSSRGGASPVSAWKHSAASCH